MVTWVHEASWSGTMLRVVDNESGRVGLIHRFPQSVVVNAVVQRGAMTLVAGEEKTAQGKVGRVWAFNARQKRELWDWKLQNAAKPFGALFSGLCNQRQLASFQRKKGDDDIKIPIIHPSEQNGR